MAPGKLPGFPAPLLASDKLVIDFNFGKQEMGTLWMDVRKIKRGRGQFGIRI